MQAASSVRGIGISRSTVGFLIGLLAALLIGAAGGFVAGSLSYAHTSSDAVAPVVMAPKDFPDREYNTQATSASDSTSAAESVAIPTDSRLGGPLP